MYNNEIKYYDELTFNSQGGMMDFYTQKFHEKLGEKANISSIKKVK